MSIDLNNGDCSLRDSMRDSSVPSEYVCVLSLRRLSVFSSVFVPRDIYLKWSVCCIPHMFADGQFTTTQCLLTYYIFKPSLNNWPFSVHEFNNSVAVSLVLAEISHPRGHKGNTNPKEVCRGTLPGHALENPTRRESVVLVYLSPEVRL